MPSHEHTFHYKENFQLEAGGFLPGFQLRYSTIGNLNADRSNVVWVCHALTGSSSFLDWWGGLFSEDSPFNPDEYFIICANTLGGCYGSTGPLSIDPETGKPYFHHFPLLSNRDVARAFDLLRRELGFERIHTLIGGSLGGQQILEWAIFKPYVIQNLISIAGNAKHSPWGIAINESHRMAIRADKTWANEHKDAGSSGLAAARAMSMITFRTYETFNEQQKDDDPKLDQYKAATYQQYQGEKLVNRFDAFSYWTLTKMMDNHDVGRERGGVESALQQIHAATLVIGIDTDLLFPVAEQELIASSIPQAQLEVIHSEFGHDAFLIETEKLKSIIHQFFKKQSKFIYNE